MNKTGAWAPFVLLVFSWTAQAGDSPGDLEMLSWQQIAERHEDLAELPESVAVRFVLGHALAAQEHTSQAIAVFATLTGEQQRKDWMAYAKSAAERPDASARARFFAGDAFLRAGEHAKAVEWFSRAIADDDREALPYLGRACARLLAGTADERPEADLKKALELGATSEACNGLAVLHLMRADPAGAAELARQGLDENPRSATCHLTLAAALVRRRDYSGALAHYDTAQALCPPVSDVCEKARNLVHARIAGPLLVQASDRAAGFRSGPEIKLENFWVPFPHIRGSRETANFGKNLADLGTYDPPSRVPQLQAAKETRLRRDVIVRSPNYLGVVQAMNQAVSIAGGVSKPVIRERAKAGPLRKVPPAPAPDSFQGALRMHEVERGGQKTWRLFEYRGGAHKSSLDMSNWRPLGRAEALDALNTRISYHERNGKRDTSYRDLFRNLSGREWHESYALATPTTNRVPSEKRGMTFGQLHDLAKRNPNAEMRVRVGDTFLKEGRVMTTTVGAFVDGKLPMTRLERVRNDAAAFTRQLKQRTGEVATPDMSWVHRMNNVSKSTPPVPSRVQSTAAVVHISSVPVGPPRPAGPSRGGVTLGKEPDVVGPDEADTDDVLFGEGGEVERLAIECMFASLPGDTVVLK